MLIRQTAPVGQNTVQGWRPAAMARARRKAGLTQLELAGRLGIAQSMVARFESGARAPRVVLAAQIADALGVDLATLAHLPQGLARLRALRGLTQQEAADQAGLTRATLQRLEVASDRVYLTDAHVTALARVYAVDDDQIRAIYNELR